MQVGSEKDEEKKKYQENGSHELPVQYENERMGEEEM